jgi:hypothetical protein
MHRIVGLAMTIVLGILASSAPAGATIDVVQSDACPLGCRTGFAHQVPRGTTTTVVVKGHLVDLATRAEVAPPHNGVAAEIVGRHGGSRSSVSVRITVGAGADLGQREIRLRYAAEITGFDKFPIRVIRRPTVQTLRRADRPAESPPRVGVDERTTLVFTGSQLAGCAVIRTPQMQSLRVLPGATDQRCEVEVAFDRAGTFPVRLIDSTVAGLPVTVVPRFGHQGPSQVQVVGDAGPAAPRAPVLPPPRASVGAGGGGAAAVLDVGPGGMANVFRRLSSFAPVTVDGATYFAVDAARWCAGMSGDQVRTITVPDLAWSVTNLGTTRVATPFQASLAAGGRVIRTETVPAPFEPGQTRSFQVAREQSQVTVRTFLARSGCFISPTAPRYFEDPPFTVTVDAANAVGEPPAQQANNTGAF